MSNSYFQFKQFRIEQDGCAMKVTTDACIQGAWTPVLPGVRNVLDVGAGSGLLSLMLAQRAPLVTIDAIEYDADAAQQAAENVHASPWSERIKVITGDAAKYAYDKKYDLIICNPPFFLNSLLSDKENKNKARHAVSFTYNDLLSIARNYLNEDGYISLLLPAEEYVLWKELAEKEGLREFGMFAVRHTDESAVKRIVGLFARGRPPMGDHSLVIKKDAANYSDEFVTLLSAFYLNL